MINALDTAVLKFFSQLDTSPWIDKTVLFLTNAVQAFMILLILTAIFFTKTRRNALAGVIAVMLSILLVEAVLKPLAARERPYELYEWVMLIGEPSKSFSFPSGHTSFAFASAATLSYRAPALQRIALFTAALFTAFSRLYLSVHYITDVMTGIFTGFLCAAAGHLIVGLVYKHMVRRKESDTSKI